MSERIKFHLDENVSNAVAEGLRRRGIDVSTTPEAGLMGVSDEAQVLQITRPKILDENLIRFF